LKRQNKKSSTKSAAREIEENSKNKVSNIGVNANISKMQDDFSLFKKKLRFFLKKLHKTNGVINFAPVEQKYSILESVAKKHIPSDNIKQTL
jgi:hypothetical protein